MKEKKSGMKLSLNRVWDRTAPSSASKVSLDDFDQGDVRRTIVSMYSLMRFCQPLITSEQSSEYWLHWQQGSPSQRSTSYAVCLHTLWGESKIADGETRCSPQQDQIPSHGQGVERGGLHR